MTLVVLGGGGHARVVIESARAASPERAVLVLDRDPRLAGALVAGAPVVGDDQALDGLVRQGATAFVIGVGGTGDNAPRARLFDEASRRGLAAAVVIDPGARVSPSAELGPGTVVLPGAIVNAGAKVGRNVIVNTGAIVEHDCVIGDHAHVATGAVLSGSVRVGALAHVGAGATVRQGIAIGERAVVGAGAVVVRDVAPGSIVVGVPARPKEPR